MAATEHEKSRFIAIWRGIAVLTVVYFHFSTRVPYEALGASAGATIPSQIGKLGVFVFFIISGFLIAKSMESCRSLAEFYAKRISRIWPLYVLASVVIFLFLQVFQPPVVLDGPKQFYAQPIGFMDLLGTVLFLNDLGFRFVDGVFWSIVAELKFYLFIGVFAVAFGSRYAKAFSIFAIGAGGMDLVLMAIMGGDQIGYAGTGPLRPVNMVLNGIFIAHYLPFFALGVALYQKQIDGVFGILVTLATVSAIIAVSEDGDFVAADSIRFLLVLSGLLAIDHFLLRDRVFVWIGDYSYSIYLFHQIIGLTLMKAIVPSVGMDLGIVLAMLAIALIAAIGSWLVEWRFRRPVANAIRVLLSGVRLNVSLDIGASARNPKMQT